MPPLQLPAQALASIDRALNAARHNSHAAGCARTINDYMICYVAASADIAKYGGAHARVRVHDAVRRSAHVLLHQRTIVSG